MANRLFRYPYHFFINYIPNHILNKVPSYTIRNLVYKKVYRIKIGDGSSIHLNTRINRFNIKIGKNSVINRNCYLDGRGEIVIGDNVSLSPEVHLITASHDLNSKDFRYISKPIHIHNFVWIGSRATIMPGVILGEGCVVATGAVVTKNVEEYDVVAGVPAKVIAKRPKDLEYHCNWKPPFD